MTRKALRMCRCILALLTVCSAVALLAGCERISSPRRSREVVDAYVAYRTAVSAGDMQGAAAHLAASRAQELTSDPAAAEKLRLMAFLMPGTMTVMGVSTEGDKGVLSLREGELVSLSGGTAAPPLGPVADLASSGGTGTVRLVRERGKWKVDTESWSHDMGGGWMVAAPRAFLEEGALPTQLKTFGGKNDSQTRATVAVAPDGSSVVTTGYGDFTISRWRVADGLETASVKMEYRPTALALTPDGGTAITADAYGGLTFWPLTPEGGFGPPHRTGSIGQSHDIALSRDGRYMAVASFDKAVSLWDVAARKEVARVKTPSPMRSVAFSPSGQLLAAGSAENTFTLWDLESGAGRTYTIPKVDPKSDVSGIAFSPDGKRLATTHMDSSITLWDVARQKEVRNFFVSGSSSWSVRFSPDGAVFATATQGGAIHLWDAKTGESRGVLKGQPSQPQGLAFSPDGAALFSAGEKGEVAVWGR